MPARRLRERGRIDRVHDPERRAFAHALYPPGREHDDTQPDRLARWRNVEPETAELLGVLIRTKRAQRILEIGTSNGYSTIWLADAAAATGGTVLTVEVEPSRTALARENLPRAGLEDRVELRTEDAAQTLRGLRDDAFELTFLDAERPHYVGYWRDLVARSRRAACSPWTTRSRTPTSSSTSAPSSTAIRGSRRRSCRSGRGSCSWSRRADVAAHLVQDPVAGRLALLGEPREQPVRGEVVGQHGGEEALDPALAGRVGERLAERGSQAAALEVVGDDERDLGDLGARRPPTPPPDADEHVRLVRRHRDEGHVIAEVDLGQVAQLPRRELVLGREEPLVGAALRQVPHALRQQRLVIRPDRPDLHLRAIVEAYAHGGPR